MNKPPAFQFYVRDWLSDPALQAASASSRGIWINALCFMWEAPERGKLTGTRESLARLLGATTGEMEEFLAEASALNFADVTESNKKVTLENRRMVKEEKERQATKLRVRKHRGGGTSNTEVTPPSSSSSSSSSSLKSSLRSDSCGEAPKAAPSPPTSPVLLTVPLVPRDGQFDITQADADQWQDTFPAVDVLAELKRLRQWNLDNPKNRKTRAGFRSHVSKWLGREQDRAQRQGASAAGVDPETELLWGKRAK